MENAPFQFLLQQILRHNSHMNTILLVFFIKTFFSIFPKNIKFQNIPRISSPGVNIKRARKALCFSTFFELFSAYFAI